MDAIIRLGNGKYYYSKVFGHYRDGKGRYNWDDYAVIDKIDTVGNDSLRVLFGGIWGCAIEMIFSGDVSYDTESRNPEIWVPYWSCGSILFHDGYVFLIDEEDI